MLPYSFNIAFSTNLIPALAASKAKGKIGDTIKRIKMSMIAAVIISLICTIIYVLFAEQILKILFPNAYLGKTMLQLSSLSIIRFESSFKISRIEFSSSEESTESTMSYTSEMTS